MLKRVLGPALALVVVALVHVTAFAKPLTIGDPAPSINVKRFVKGAPVTKFEKGKLYVVEFWATWCGPCKMSIPHLTELQKKFKDVTFIGVSVSEQSQALVEPFVAQMGAKMDYRVAMDNVPQGKDGYSGAMQVHWMQAARQSGIPTAFIVDKQTRIAWIGHPMVMEQPLTKIVAGNWNPKAEAEKLSRQQAVAAKMRAIGQQYGAAMAAKDYNKALSVLNSAIAEYPNIEPQLAFAKVGLLIQTNKTDAAAAYGNKLIAGTFNANAMALNQLAWGMVDPAQPKRAAAVVNMGLKAAMRADELSRGKNPAITDTLAAAYYAAGKAAQAVQAQERAINLAKGTQQGRDPSLAQRLATYKKALHQL